MVIDTPPQLTMWYDNVDGDHTRILNKYILKELIDMNGWEELIEVITRYWDSQRMVFLFKIIEITLTLEEIRDCIDIVGTGRERR